MSASGPPRVVVVGGGPAGAAALERLPGAVAIARPGTTAWHAEPGRLWVEGDGRVWAQPFDALLVCADEPLLLAAMGCAFSGGRVAVDGEGRTSVPGVFAAGRITGAGTAQDAAAQARIAAGALRAGRLGPAPAATDTPSTAVARLDPSGIAALLERPAGPARDAEALAQCALLGPLLPARPVSLAALAALVDVMPDPVPPQRDGGPPA